MSERQDWGPVTCTRLESSIERVPPHPRQEQVDEQFRAGRDRIVEDVGGDLACTDMFRFTTVRSLAQHIDHHIPTGSGGTGWERAQFRRAVMLGRRGEVTAGAARAVDSGGGWPRGWGMSL